MTVRDVVGKIKEIEEVREAMKANISFITESINVYDVLDIFSEYVDMLLDQKVERMK